MDGVREAGMPRPLVSAALAGLRHGFLTRQGGVSEGRFGSLNCSLSGRDEAARVAENRARAARSVGVEPGELLALWQVHSAEVVMVREAWGDEARPRADAFVTDRPGVALGIVTADCVPVLLADATAQVVGAVHAGWRGAAAGILEATVAAMLGLGAEPARIAAAIGPSIRQASYQVGPDLRDAFLAQDAGAERFFGPDPEPRRWRFDLQGACRARLEAAGVGLVDDLGLDTLADEARFFSYRRSTLSGEGPIGHQISIIAAG